MYRTPIETDAYYLQARKDDNERARRIRLIKMLNFAMPEDMSERGRFCKFLGVNEAGADKVSYQQPI